MAKKERRVTYDESLSLKEAAEKTTKEILDFFGTSLSGLDEEEVTKNRIKYGPNIISPGRKKTLLESIKAAYLDPFSMILISLAFLSFLTDVVFPHFSILGSTVEDFNPMTASIILFMILSSGTLRFIEKKKSEDASAELLSMITTTCTVTRKGNQKMEINPKELVAGDIVHLSAGDMVPADVRIIEAKDFFLSESSLTGESIPVEKTTDKTNTGGSITDYNDIAFILSNVISGSAVGVVIKTGDRTVMGSTQSEVNGRKVGTNFQKGISRVSKVLIHFSLVMVPLVFFINGITKKDWLDAFMFGISIAVGLTPEMLPMIVSTCLSKGAVSMSRKNTIVKNIDSIQNFGALDVLCTDKTGTLTENKEVLEYHLNVDGENDMRVLGYAYLTSYFQTGYRNLLDDAVIKKTEEEEELTALSNNYVKVDEIPFDFIRRRLTTVVRDKDGKTEMVTKGAVEEMLSICSYVEDRGKTEPMTESVRSRIEETASSLNEKGFRVLAVARKDNPTPEISFGINDESDMVLIGYLAFLDPPKESAAAAVNALRSHGVTTKILTGDNEKVTRTISKEVGLDVKSMLSGSDLENMTDEDLREKVETTDVFAKLTPLQKSRVVKALRANGHTVGFLGDGINDAAALTASDIGISVDTAVDTAKESADIILLEKDLMVLEEGIIEGRKTYTNMMKYIKMTASSNYGNMFSVLAASILLPFLPMTSLELLFLNMVYDLCCTSIPWDNVDEEYLLKPRVWNASSVSRFMMWFGPASSLFDIITYVFMYFVICPAFISNGVLFNNLSSLYSGELLTTLTIQYISLFQTGWFVESIITQTLVIHMIRTPKLSFIESRASLPVMILTLLGSILLTVVPYTPVGRALGFRSLPLPYFLFLFPCIALYMLLMTFLKKAYIRRYGELL